MPDFLFRRIAEHLRRVHAGTVVFDDEAGKSHRFGEGSPVSRVQWSARATRGVLLHGPVGFCDGFVKGHWEMREGALLDFLRSLLRAGLAEGVEQGMPAGLRWAWRALPGLIALARSAMHRSVRTHYELGNDFFERWLDPSMTYTCGYARSPQDSLEQMQTFKHEVICDKLRLQRGDRVLDLGCGWGAFALHAARHHGAHVTAVNISPPQLRVLEERSRSRGLDANVTALFSDFRRVTGQWDAAVSIGLAEHVGRVGLPQLFSALAANLVEGGTGLVHCIGTSGRPGTDPWIERRVFPGSYVPNLSELVQAAERAGLRVCHVENIGPHYALTLNHWRERYLRSADWVRMRYGDEFHRTWEMYLTILIPVFESLSTGLFQLLTTKGLGASPRLGKAPLGWPVSMPESMARAG